MRRMPMVGYLALFLICISPLIPWYLSGHSISEISTYADGTHALGQIAALVGMTMFALTFVLSTRLRFIEDIFGGLDKVYVAHSILGGIAFMLLLFHPILIVLKFIPSDMTQAAKYLLPSSYWSVNFGMIALVGMIVLLFVTFYIKIKYQRWKFSHTFLGLFFIFAVLHIFMVRDDAARDMIFTGYYVYAAIVSAIGISAFIYSLLFKSKGAVIYKIDSINKTGDHIYDIKLLPKYKSLRYRSGQFVFLRFFNDKVGNEPHPFSISSMSNDNCLRFVIKSLGDFTATLDALEIGDTVSVEGPYGRFNHDRGKTDQVWLAGGIGITPFIGMAQDLVSIDMENHIDLYYSVKDNKGFIGLGEFKEVERATGGRFRVFPWVTNHDGRLTIKDIDEKSGPLKRREFCMCGPEGFKNAMKESLTKAGVRKSRIHEEEFTFK
ncbi:hypothetical protein COT47_02525 [Candidatus Woesearchaeota archaeon CG08_land_8_20_14_0_20_43_7]|nr:MAG: hypothetical protein COT47_02525 [Candidatus Woesearchaeota archaeon CG08_land_8_20_14_0_20_43_7]